MNQIVIIGTVKEFESYWGVMHEDFKGHYIPLVAAPHMLGYFKDGMMVGVKGTLKSTEEGKPFIRVEHIAMIGGKENG